MFATTTHTAPAQASDQPPPPFAVPELEEVELTLATHLTIVVRARLQFADGSEDETGLVIPRQLCVGEQPSAGALATAARDSAHAVQARALATLRPLAAVSVRRGARWQVLWTAAPERLAA